MTVGHTQTDFGRPPNHGGQPSSRLLNRPPTSTALAWRDPVVGYNEIPFCPLSPRLSVAALGCERHSCAAGRWGRSDSGSSRRVDVVLNFDLVLPRERSLGIGPGTILHRTSVLSTGF
jgi:hypothetical protein